jgi:Mn-dependent DtxR family transcriptional regulator
MKIQGNELNRQGIEAAKPHKRYGILAEFFKMIGVQTILPTKTQRIEHHLHSGTLKKLEDFVRSLKGNHKIQ